MSAAGAPDRRHAGQGAADDGDPAAEVVAHLRQAALDMLAAAHAALDVAEGAVRSPADVAARIAGAVIALRTMIVAAEPAAGDGGNATTSSAPRVQRIRIS